MGYVVTRGIKKYQRIDSDDDSSDSEIDHEAMREESRRKHRKRKRKRTKDRSKIKNNGIKLDEIPTGIYGQRKIESSSGFSSVHEGGVSKKRSSLKIITAEEAQELIQTAEYVSISDRAQMKGGRQSMAPPPAPPPPPVKAQTSGPSGIPKAPKQPERGLFE